MTNRRDAQLRRIYATLLNHHLRDFDDALKPLGDPIVKATVELYANIAEELLPTPSKSHYLFNTRDLAKVIQGTMQTTRQYYAEKDQILQLWCHECFSVFGLACGIPTTETGSRTSSIRNCCTCWGVRGRRSSSRSTASVRRSSRSCGPTRTTRRTKPWWTPGG